VYHARHAVAPSSEVALKVLLNEKDQKANGEKLRKEALAMVSSRHKYVIRLDDFHSVGDLCYLSMEYAPESDLRKYIAKTGGRLHPVQAELFLLQLAEALAFMHRSGIVHRDIKPDNILVVTAKEIRLADFGVAVLPGEQSSLAELQKGVGTMDYMAPEVLEGKKYDLQSDIYALGVTFYELLSGKHPFAAAPLIEQLTIRKDGKFPHLRQIAPEVPAYLANVIMQAMSYEPSTRFPSTKELAQALLMNRTKPAETKPQTQATSAISATAQTQPPAAPPAPKASAATAPQASAPASAPRPTAPTAASPAPAAPAQTAQASTTSQAPKATPTAPATGTTPVTPGGPSPSILAAVRAAAAGKQPLSSSVTQTTTKTSTTVTPAQPQTAATPTPPKAEGPQANATRTPPATPPANRPPAVGADSPEARRSTAQHLLGRTPSAPSTAPAISGSAALATQPADKMEASTTAASQPATSAYAANSQPARPTSMPARETTPTQVMSRTAVDEVTGPAKAKASDKDSGIISRAFEASSAVSEAKQTLSERPTPSVPSPNAAPTQTISPALLAAARSSAGAGKSEKGGKQSQSLAKAATELEATQPITREMVEQAKAAQSGKGNKEDKAKVDEAKRASRAAEQLKEKEVARNSRGRSELWKKDPRKSRYMAISMGVLLVILWFGNIFLIKNYHIGIGKSFLGYDEEYASPIPEFTAKSLEFPALPSGLYAGYVKNLIPDQTLPLTIISFGEQKKVAVIVGIQGWTPAVVSVTAAAGKEDGNQALRIVSNGLVLNMTGQVAGMALQGTFQDVITGDQSEWHAKPVTH
jgi:serine/threonine-protein kinase